MDNFIGKWHPVEFNEKVCDVCLSLSAALRGWAGKNSSNLPFHRSEKSAERDFMALNVAAVQRGLITAPEHYMFRATHDIRKKVSDNDNKKYKTRRLPPSMVFGVATRWVHSRSCQYIPYNAHYIIATVVGLSLGLGTNVLTQSLFIC